MNTYLNHMEVCKNVESDSSGFGMREKSHVPTMLTSLPVDIKSMDPRIML